ncbi:MAG TPA: hypothetical protein DDZ68_14970 [Parvularcula sp.]|nr:hypothetical protein [Parvularcula sp.]HBS33438.1 hypothetical protein [Parvularcula sp.]
MPRSSAVAILAVALCAGLAAAGEMPRRHELQLGVGLAAPYNLEEAFLNLAQTRAAGWQFDSKGGRVRTQEALAEGYLDPVTWMPTEKAGAMKSGAIAQFFSSADGLGAFHADEWVIDWKGDAYGFMQRWEGKGRPVRDKNSVTYDLTAQSFSDGSLRFSRIGAGLSDIRLYRRKNADRLARGEVWNPVFLDYARRYDVIRTMDVQGTNNSQVRRFDQIATMAEPWGQRSGTQWPEPPFFGAPYEILFDLGARAGSKLWVTVPPQIGSPISWADPSLRRKDRPDRLDGALFVETTAKHARTTVESEEWDVFAREFAKRLAASDYPLERTLYVELGNEMWNNAAGFFVSTAYAHGIAKGFNADWRAGHGYGVLSARLALAMEKAFAAQKIRPRIVYVLGTHTANPTRTRDALKGFSAYIEMKGEDPKAYLAKTGVAVTNYFGRFSDLTESLFGEVAEAEIAARWIAAVRDDPETVAAKITAHITKGPASAKATAAWLVDYWGRHKAIAEEAGSTFIGAYEGGSHLNLPSELAKSPEFMAFWRDYHWGEQGAGVTREVNRRLIEAFPGVMIANYLSMGRLNGAAPWNDGHYSAQTPMMRMWDEFARKGE